MFFSATRGPPDDRTAHSRIGPAVPGVDHHEPPRAERTTRRRRRRHRDAARGALARRDVVDAVARPRASRPVRPGRRARSSYRVVDENARQLEALDVPREIAGDARNQLDDELQRDVEHTLPNLRGARELERRVADPCESHPLLDLDRGAADDEQPPIAASDATP